VPREGEDLCERVLALLPPEAPILEDALWQAARAAGLHNRQIGSALAALCSDGRAHIERREYSFVRRGAAALVARPVRKARAA
jgi:hypothetical protein